MSEQLKGEIQNIWSRLFDHKFFLQGSVQFTLKEFEEKRQDTEVEQLFKLLENVTELKDGHIDKLKTALSNSLEPIQSSLDSALKVCSDIENIEQKFKEDTTLQISREKRRVEWEHFIDDITYKCKKVDLTFEEKGEELQEFYNDLERRLNIK